MAVAAASFAAAGWATTTCDDVVAAVVAAAATTALVAAAGDVVAAAASTAVTERLCAIAGTGTVITSHRIGLLRRPNRAKRSRKATIVLARRSGRVGEELECTLRL